MIRFTRENQLSFGAFLAPAFFLCAGFLICATHSLSAESAAINKSIIDSYENHYIELKEKIRTSKSSLTLGRKAISGEMLDQQALIFSTDQNPTGVVLRRTAALIADLRNKFPGNLEIAALENNLRDLKARN